MEQVYFILTERCNLSCSHCIRDSSPHRTETSEIERIKKTLDEINLLSPNSLILLSGGEPTIYRGFFEILEYAQSLGFKININSNGATSFFKEKNLLPLMALEGISFQISLDGVESVHDGIRGDRSFRRALNAINLLRQMDIKCSVSTTVVNINFFSSTLDFIKLLDNLGLSHLAIKRATYAGRASDGASISTADWNEQVRRLRNFSFKTKLNMHPMYEFSLLDTLTDQELLSLKLPLSARNCGAGLSKIYIYPDGNVCSCTCFKDHPMGNLYAKSLLTILDNVPTFKVTNKTCKTCRYFRICNGGCLGSGYGSTGIINSPDPRCPKHEKFQKNDCTLHQVY